MTEPKTEEATLESTPGGPLETTTTDSSHHATALDGPLKSKKRKERLEQNRMSARESRKRKKTMIEELQRTVITMSRENSELKKRHEQLQAQLLEIRTKYPNVVPIQAILNNPMGTPPPTPTDPHATTNPPTTAPAAPTTTTETPAPPPPAAVAAAAAQHQHQAMAAMAFWQQQAQMATAAAGVQAPPLPPPTTETRPPTEASKEAAPTTTTATTEQAPQQSI